jgi:hypothetical protein
MAAADLLPANALPAFQTMEDIEHVPLVSHATAMHEPIVRPSAVRSLMWVPSGLIESARSHPTPHRRTWQRFIAISISAVDAMPMDPVIQPDSTVVLDRHYNALIPYRSSRPTIFALRVDAHLKLRYADFLLSRLVLRPHNRAFPVELTDTEPGETSGDLVVGRVILVLNGH